MDSIFRRCIRVLLGAVLLAVGLAQAQEIRLAQIGPFTVLPVPDAVEVNQGIRAAIGQANDTGGVRGRKFSFFELDDQYSPEVFEQQFKKALASEPIALLSPIGSASLSRMLADHLLANADIVIVNAIPGAESLRNPGDPKLFHVRAGDKQQIEKIVNHARTLGISKLSLVYQDLPIGVSGMEVATRESARLPGLAMTAVKSGTAPEQLAAAAKQVSGQQAQGVLVVGAPRFMADAVAALRKAGVSQSVFVLSYVPAGLVVKLAGADGARGVGIAQTFPDPNGTTLAIHREFGDAMKKAYPNLRQYTHFQLEGYLSARLVVEALKRSKDKEISAATLQRALKTTGPFDLGGFRVDFSASNEGSRYVDIGVISADGRLRY